VTKILSKFHVIQDKTLTGHCVACVKKKLGRTCDTLIRKKCYHAAYALGDELKAFVDNDFPLPLGVNLQCLGDSSGIASTMLKMKLNITTGVEIISVHITKDPNCSPLPTDNLPI